MTHIVYNQWLMAPHAKLHGTIVAQQLLRRGDVCAACYLHHERLSHESSTAREILMRKMRGERLVDVTRGDVLRELIC